MGSLSFRPITVNVCGFYYLLILSMRFDRCNKLSYNTDLFFTLDREQIISKNLNGVMSKFIGIDLGHYLYHRRAN
ncbi:MAG: hypothetical protein QGG39_16785 [Candidatus Poribacteria bacterium]|nr:hypothetical protein [Candidatus Poribacteria bacterium]